METEYVGGTSNSHIVDIPWGKTFGGRRYRVVRRASGNMQRWRGPPGAGVAAGRRGRADGAGDRSRWRQQPNTSAAGSFHHPSGEKTNTTEKEKATNNILYELNVKLAESRSRLPCLLVYVQEIA